MTRERLKQRIQHAKGWYVASKANRLARALAWHALLFACGLERAVVETLAALLAWSLG